MAFAIFIRDQSAQLACHVCAKDSVYIGRSPENDIVLFDASVSKRHCQVSLSGGALIISDLNSSNGVIVNDEKIKATALVKPEDRIKIRSYDFSIRMLSSEEQARYDSGLDPQCILPTVFTSEMREGDGGQKGGEKPVSLDSIYRAIDETEQVITVENQAEAHSPRSLNSIFHAVSTEESTLLEKQREQYQVPSSLNSIFEAVTPPPTDPLLGETSEPQSLNSIFNAVSPLSDVVINKQDRELVEESLIDSPPLAQNLTNDILIHQAGSGAESVQTSVQTSSLHSIFNAVNPTPEFNASAADQSKSEPKSLNSVFNVVNPIPEELLGRSLEGELRVAHEELTHSQELEKPKNEPKSLNSIFNAVNPIATHLKNQKESEGQ